jgi:hypothetical protein
VLKTKSTEKSGVYLLFDISRHMWLKSSTGAIGNRQEKSHSRDVWTRATLIANMIEPKRPMATICGYRTSSPTPFG